MNLVDLAVIVLAALAAFRGWRRGMVGQIFELGGGFVGLLAGVALGPTVAGIFTKQAGVEAALISLGVVLVCLSIGQTLGYVIGHRFGLAAHRARLGRANSVLGSGFGIVVTLVSFWVIGSLLVAGPSLEVARAVRKSSVLRTMNGFLPKPPDVLGYLRQYLETSGFPQVFVGLPRPVGPPAELPSNKEARQAIDAADGSTVRIVVPACGGTLLGTGWISAPNTVVTNAHVVAGGTDVTVQDSAGDHQGVVVLFDPATDLAIVHVEGLAGEPLTLETEHVADGTGGATLGFPGEEEGRFVADRAAVQNNFEAVGRDIYGRSVVRRDVYELRSDVREGDSGGPFVLPDGRVAGVVFAASTTNGDVGYALTGAEVAEEVQEGASLTAPVSTGGCTR